MRNQSAHTRPCSPRMYAVLGLWMISVSHMSTVCVARNINGPVPTPPPFQVYADTDSYNMLLVSDARSLVPSMVPTLDESSIVNMPSDMPSLVPSKFDDGDLALPTTITPSVFQSDYPSIVPSATAIDYPTTPIPSVALSDWPSMVPSSTDKPVGLDDATVLDSVLLSTAQRQVMDDSTVAIFEKVCREDFLPWYMPRIYSAIYTNIACTVLSQSTLDSLNRNLLQRGRRLRRLQTDERSAHDNVLGLFTNTTTILLHITMEANLPNGVKSTDILRRTFEQYVLQFQLLLSDKTSYFEPLDDGLPATIDGIARDSNSSTDAGIPKIVVIASALVGAGLALSLAIIYTRRREQKTDEALSPNDVTDDSVLLIFDNEHAKKDPTDVSYNPYLPPTPLGAGVPSEIGPDSWIEPDDELSQGSPENQGIEAFLFNRTSEKESNEKILSQSRATEILKSLSVGVESTSNYMPYHVPSVNVNLSSLESGESVDEHSRPTVSSRGSSQPTKSSVNSRQTNGSISDGSSTLHGLKLVGTMSSFQRTDTNDTIKGNLPTPARESPALQKKSSFIQKMMHRKASRPAPSPKNKSPAWGSPVAQDAVNSSTAASRETGAALPKSVHRSIPRPRSLDGRNSASDKKDRPRLSLSVESVAEAEGPRDSSIITDRVTAIAQVFNEMEEAHISSIPPPTVNEISASNKKRLSKSVVGETRGRGHSGMKNAPKFLAEPTKPKTNISQQGTEKSFSTSPASPDISVDLRRAAGTPTGGTTLGRFEECTPRSPMGSFVRKNETPSGTRFLQMNLASAEHTGDVLEDLGRLEDEWDGQLESMLSASATTPRRTNSEKFRKAPRRHIYDES